MIIPVNNQESLKRKANSSLHKTNSQSSRKITNNTTPIDYEHGQINNSIKAHKEKKAKLQKIWMN